MNRKALEAVYGAEFVGGNEVKMFAGGGVAFQSLLEAVASARRRISVQFYIFRNDETGTELAEALARKAAEGVTVNLLYDHLGSIATPLSFWRGLKARGINVRASYPFLWLTPWKYFHRDHRKLVIVDDAIAYTGGLNMANEYWGFRLKRKRHWRDTGVLVKGPAAAALSNEFSKAWEGLGRLFKRCKVEPCDTAPQGTLPLIPIFASSNRGRRRMRRLLHYSIASAQKEIAFTTAYFTPSTLLLQGLKAAVARGARVRLLIPEHSDVPMIDYVSRHYFGQLLKAGVEVYNYQGVMLHAKTYVFDGLWSIVGSANLDYRSLRYNDEGNAGILDEGFAADMMLQFEEDLKQSVRVEYDKWAARSWKEKLMERLIVPFRRKL